LSSIKVLGAPWLEMLRYRPDTRQSGMDGPKTRTEAKGRDKKKGRDVYSAKHVRIAAATAEAAAKKPKDPGKK
jgi:hypothetical protein